MQKFCNFFLLFSENKGFCKGKMYFSLEISFHLYKTFLYFFQYFQSHQGTPDLLIAQIVQCNTSLFCILPVSLKLTGRAQMQSLVASVIHSHQGERRRVYFPFFACASVRRGNDGLQEGASATKWQSRAIYKDVLGSGKIGMSLTFQAGCGPALATRGRQGTAAQISWLKRARMAVVVGGLEGVGQKVYFQKEGQELQVSQTLRQSSIACQQQERKTSERDRPTNSTNL